MNALQRFLTARDFLLRHRADYDYAYRHFTWPALDDFNWAIDYFDEMARGNDAPALWLVDAGTEQETKLSFAQLSERSARIANFLREIGVGRGDRILLMLPNRVELWDAMLAAIKLGAILMPATTQLSADDLRERIEIGEPTFAIVDTAECGKFDNIDAPLVKVAVGAPASAVAQGWRRFEDGYAASPTFEPSTATRAGDPLLLYFTSGTTSKPKLVEHTHESYPVGSLSTMYWVGLQPGDIHWNIIVPSPDPLRLSVPKAYIMLRHGYTFTPELAKSIFAFSRERLSAYKRIQRLELYDLPKTISGKIRRVELRRREMERGEAVERLPGEYWDEDFPDRQ